MNVKAYALMEPSAEPLKEDIGPTCDWSQLDWYALYTNIRCEKRARDGLREKGFEVFAPFWKRWVKPRRSKAWHQTERPLFTRYIFIGFPAGHANWWAVRTTDGVESIVCIDYRPIKIPPSKILHILEEVRAEKFDDDNRPRRRPRTNLKKGDMVAVSVPGMGNTTAVVRRHAKPYADRVLVDLLGRAVQVPVDSLTVIEDTEHQMTD